MAGVGEDIVNQIESLPSGYSQSGVGGNRQETDVISRWLCGERMCVHHRADTSDRAG